MMLAFLYLPHYFWHPLTGNGYQFWSGIGSDIGELTIVGGLITIALQTYRHNNCHVVGCRKLGHNDPAVHAPACRDHHSLGHKHGVDHSLL